ncbi:MAG TPA: heme exporter protein CcmD [Gammaproteobacteria bacterium]|jgi:heme exporter protein CcmD|nr:heme exporter protein CcmD [Gammaproteobacteria bacterium]
MGGHAAYVWTAYGITLAVIIFNVWSARRKLLNALGEARRARETEGPRSQPKVRQLS